MDRRIAHAIGDRFGTAIGSFRSNQATILVVDTLHRGVAERILDGGNVMRPIRIFIEVFGNGILLIHRLGAVDELVNLDQIALGIVFILELRNRAFGLGSVLIQAGRCIDGGDPVAIGGIAVKDDGFRLFSIGIVRLDTVIIENDPVAVVVGDLLQRGFSIGLNECRSGGDIIPHQEVVADMFTFDQIFGTILQC